MSANLSVRGLYTRAWHGHLMNLTLRGQAVPPPSLEAGLSFLGASNDGTIAEPSAPSYARLPIPPGTFSEPHPNLAPQTENKAALVWPAPAEDWGDQPLRSVFLRDTVSGVVVASIDLTEPRPVRSGDASPRFEIGALRFAAV